MARAAEALWDSWRILLGRSMVGGLALAFILAACQPGGSQSPPRSVYSVAALLKQADQLDGQRIRIRGETTGSLNGQCGLDVGGLVDGDDWMFLVWSEASPSPGTNLVVEGVFSKQSNFGVCSGPALLEVGPAR